MNDAHEIRFLRETPFPVLHAAMTEAFADYLLDMSYMTEEVTRVRAAKNGVDLGCSPGAFADGRLVGLTLVGLGRWNSEPAAFDACTGIVKEHRGHGLAGRLFEAALPELQRRGVRRFVLEVLQENAPAVKAYEKTGFQITRSFDCYEQGEAPGRSTPDVELRPVGPELLADFEGELDWTPSWENSFDAIRAIPQHVRLFGAFQDGRCEGIVAYLPALRWVMTVVVRRSHRGRGLGSALVCKALDSADPGGRPVRVNNVDATDAGMVRFLVRNGFRVFTTQYEMVSELH